MGEKKEEVWQYKMKCAKLTETATIEIKYKIGKKRFKEIIRSFCTITTNNNKKELVLELVFALG